MRKKLAWYLISTLLVIMSFIIGLNYFISTDNLEKNAEALAKDRIDQLYRMIQKNEIELENLWDSLSEDYLTRAKAFAYMIEQNPKLLESKTELERVKGLLNVDELHVIDENGILQYGTIESYFGFDFATTDQTREFLGILDDPSVELVQEIRPNGAEKKLFQYIGVARKDKKGIVQVGLNPSRYMEAKKRNELPYIFSKIPMEEGSFMEAIDQKSGKILAQTDFAGDKSVSQNKELLSRAEQKKGEFIRQRKDKNLYVVRQYDDLLLCVGQSEEILFQLREKQMFQVFLYLSFVTIAAIFVLDFILKRNIINGIFQVIEELKKITGGNLDTVVAVGGNKEFEALSREINTMVKSVLDTTVKISRIIDMVGVLFGAFEYKKDMRRVLATEGVSQIIGLTKEEAHKLYQDKHKFSDYICQLKNSPEQMGVYKICDNPERWIKINEVTDEQGTFGVVQDVTEEMLEKMHLIKERDYDALTGLFSRMKFEREVKKILEEKKKSEAAMVMFDLDYFKKINDCYGHGFGDRYLKLVGKIFLFWQEANIITGRRSGDEFYAFFYDFPTKESILEQLEQFYSLLKQNLIICPNGEKKEIHVTSGIAFQEQIIDYSELLERADIALYCGKKEQKGSFFQYSMNKTILLDPQ